MSSPISHKTVRRSVALPADLVDEALRSTPSEERPSFNRLVRRLLEEHISKHKAASFAADMARMAADAAIRRESSAIATELAVAEGDGLEDL